MSKKRGRNQIGKFVYKNLFELTLVASACQQLSENKKNGCAMLISNSIQQNTVAT